MKKFFENLSWQKGESAFVRVLLSWRLWILGAILGAILGVALSFVLPKRYETFATVIVDHNREQAWVNTFDKNISYFYDIENRKIEAVALGDNVLEKVIEKYSEISVVDLRENMLQIVKQYDGIWELHVVSEDATLSQNIAKEWALAFTNEVMDSISFEKDLEVARAEYMIIQDREICEIQENGVNNENWAILNENAEDFKNLVKNAKGISPYIEIFPVSIDNLVVFKTPVDGVLIILGVTIGIITLLGLGIFFIDDKEE